MDIEEKYMIRCLQLAQMGKGHVSPNPLVGAVIVHNGKIIGEGYHRKYGQAHAEVNAILSVEDTSLLKDSTLYVNLEPCSHYGKTPPCSELIIEKKIPCVVIGNQDPYPKVSGNGIRMLKAAGIEVVCDFMKNECEEVNKRFLTYHRKKRPYIILKWAQSADNYMDRIRVSEDGTPAVQFSNDLTRMMVHKMRAEEDAIMVGTRTALLDNPSLNVRFWQGANPLRIVIDRNMVIPPSFHLLDGKSDTIVITDVKCDSQENEYCTEIDFEEDVLSQILDILYHQKVQSLIVEGGAVLLSHFIRSGLWDQADIETAPFPLKEGVSAPSIRGMLIDVKKCKQSIVSVYKNIHIP